MLKTLRITNYSLIEDLTLPFEPGLNVLTGETGAGKTILLEALGLLLGRRSESGAVRPGAAQARVEGIWEIPESGPAAVLLRDSGIEIRSGEVSVRRDLSAEGRGRAFMNGSPVTVSFLKEFGEALLRVHGQADNQDYRGLGAWADLLDKHGGAWPLREKIAEALIRLKGLEAEMEELGGDPQERARKLEYLRYQSDEIEKSDLKAGEEEAVAAALKVQQNAQRILGHLGSAEELLDGEAASGGALASLGRAATELRAASALGTPTGPLAERLEILESEARDALREVSRLREGLSMDPEEAQRLTERLDLIRSLQRKYGPSVEEVLENGKKFKEEIGRMEGGEGRLRKLEEERVLLRKDLRASAEELRKRRTRGASEVRAAMAGELSELHLRQAAVEIQWSPAPSGVVDLGGGWFVGRRGADDLEIRFSANPGLPPQPLGQVASGGELSRVCLALLAVLGAEAGISAYVFDEIDAGVGGEAVWGLGRRLHKLAREAQVLVVTHQPAVARFGDHHLKVSKEVRGGTSRLVVSVVEGEDRIAELARMMGGKELGPKALEHARDLFEKK